MFAVASTLFLAVASALHAAAASGWLSRPGVAVTTHDATSAAVVFGVCAVAVLLTTLCSVCRCCSRPQYSGSEDEDDDTSASSGRRRTTRATPRQSAPFAAGLLTLLATALALVTATSVAGLYPDRLVFFAPASHTLVAAFHAVGVAVLLWDAWTASPKITCAVVVAVVAIAVGMSSRGIASGSSRDRACAIGLRDSPWRDGPPSSPPPKVGHSYNSTYVLLSDGTKLAADIYLPALAYVPSLGGVPVAMVFTSTGRALSPRWPFSLLFTSSWAGAVAPSAVQALVDELLLYNYGVVVVDVRGTGASTGHRLTGVSPRETSDVAEVAQWVRHQDWSNGKLAAHGVFLEGVAVAQAAARLEGDISAISLVSTPVDLFDEVLAPGGRPNVGALNALTEASQGRGNRVEASLSWKDWVFKTLAFSGPAPVNGEPLPRSNSVSLATSTGLPEGLFAGVPEMEFKDGSENGDNAGEIDGSTLGKLREAKVAVYAAAGFYDGGAARGAERLIRALGSEHVLVTLGPWTTGLEAACSPFNQMDASFVPCFPLAADIRRFFDKAVKEGVPPGRKAREGQSGGLRRSHTTPGSFETSQEVKAPPKPSAAGSDGAAVDADHSVHYYVQGFDTVGHRAWRWADSWPPANLGTNEWFLGTAKQLLSNPLNRATPRGWPLNSTATTGRYSRWNFVQSLLGSPVAQARRDRATAAADVAVFSSSPLEGPFTITGTASLVLPLRLPAGTDVTVFAQIDDVYPRSGVVIPVTEGHVRVGHRCTEPQKDSTQALTKFEQDVCFRSYLKKDFREAGEDEVASVALAFEPTSYHFQRGHRLRVVLSTADVDNFGATEAVGEWQIELGPQSKLVLPVENDKVMTVGPDGKPIVE